MLLPCVLLPTGSAFRCLIFLTRCSAVPDGNDTNNQPTQGPRHYDTLATKLFYGILLSESLKDNAAALPVVEEVAEG